MRAKERGFGSMPVSSQPVLPGSVQPSGFQPVMVEGGGELISYCNPFLH